MRRSSSPIKSAKESEKKEKSKEKNAESPSVKSTAVVKYTSVSAPANFAQLKHNTDLKLPPSNWLRSSTASYGLHHVLPHKTGFSSFLLAHMFPDCVGEVDVVSDAENIKKLMKIPYTRGQVSMMVHRVENTLLIDEFDIHKHLLRQSENDWSWLRKFFFDHIFQRLSDKEKRLLCQNNMRFLLQEKSLVSKFLHYSLAEPDVPNGEVAFTTVPTSHYSSEPLPEPGMEERLPDSTSHQFNRNVVWTFENIQMLLGTDMPIFGGSTHPCISLRLRDVAKPINVLTGIDYWLDNLMSNVPEVVMCYHLDGIVQKYELIKTEDLPQLPDAKFSPKLIRDVAQNILSFLKTNATKAGHTYWLFKARNDEVVKLYDLSSLCSDTLIDKELNPFTVPVGMLLYRVARNMKQSSGSSPPQPGTVRMLLKNCLSLLPREKYPHIVTSAHYMLSDLYVPKDTDPSSPQLIDEPMRSEPPEEEVEDDGNHNSSVPVDSLCLASVIFPESKYNHPPPLVGSVEERCKMALSHVQEGFECLKFFDLRPEKKTDTKASEEPKMAKPFESIPMPYEKLPNTAEKVKEEAKGKKKKKKDPKGKQDSLEETDNSIKALLCRPQGDTIPTWQEPEKMDNAMWKRHLSNLLQEKALLVYTTLVEHMYNSKRYGLALKYISCVLSSSAVNRGLCSLLLDRAGDCCISIHQKSDDLTSVKEELKEEIISVKFPTSEEPLCSDLNVVPGNVENFEDVLFTSLRCYERAAALKFYEASPRKLGNVHNEIGSIYLGIGGVKYRENHENLKLEDIQPLMFKAERHLNLSLKSFESVSDILNQALIHSNTGKLMRLKAHCFPDSQKNFYKRAEQSYILGLSLLENRKASPGLWDAIYWELSSLLFKVATSAQDYPVCNDKSQDELEREVASLLQKALKYCDLDHSGPKLPVYQFRAAKLHQRLGKLYHKIYRDQKADEGNRKAHFQLSQLYYLKASKLFYTLEHPSDFLTVQLERIALFEFSFLSLGATQKKIKELKKVLEVFSESKAMLAIIEEGDRILGDTSTSLDSPEKAEKEEEAKLLKLLEQRLQWNLKCLIKLCLTSTDKKILSTADGYKEVYTTLLRRGEGDLLSSHLLSVVGKLSSVEST